jgi:hypothetical protein
MRMLSIFFDPQRKLKSVEWAHCYRAIRNKLKEEATIANTEYLQELIDLLVLIETTLDIKNIDDLERYTFNYEERIIRLSDSMWNIIRSVIPLGGEEEELEEEDIDGE